MKRQVILGILAAFLMVSDVKSACLNNCESLPNCADLGYKKITELVCPEGLILCPFDTSYGYCKEYTCSDGRYFDAEVLGQKKGYQCESVAYHGLTCYNCYCDPDPTVCKWTLSNKGYAEISDECCDGKYAACENVCKDTVVVPEHATGIKKDCTGCGQTVQITTKWQCNEWYDEMKGQCYPRPCPEGYSSTYPDVNSCGHTGKGDTGWTWDSNGYSGPDICGRCTERECQSGFDANFQSVTDCGDKGENGWDYAKDDVYNGDLNCGKCTPRECPSPYISGIASVADCGNKTIGERGWKYERSLTYNGEQPCGKCEAKTCKYTTAPENAHCTETCYAGDSEQCNQWVCNDGYQLNSKGTGCEVKPCAEGYATGADKCGNGIGRANGWKLGTESNGQSGADKCYQCIQKECQEGDKDSDTDSNVNTCSPSPYPSANHATKTQVANVYHGDEACYKCHCAAPELTCKWNDGNKGTAELSNQCCDGNYEKCTSSCVAATAPANAHLISPCTGCNEQVYTGWECNQWYQKNGAGNGCDPAPCPDGYTTDNDIGKCGSGGWQLSNTDTKGQSGASICKKCEAKPCPNGEKTEYSNVGNCGTQGGWTSSPTNNYSGETACYKCTEKPCTEFPLTSCDTTSSNCSSCQKGDSTVYKVETCKEGWTKSGNNCVESACEGFTLNECPTGADGCETCKKGTTTKYKVNGCNSGWYKQGDTCVENSCSDFPLDGCPDHGNCTPCQKGNAVKYRLDNCQQWWTKNGNTCTPTPCPTGSDTSNAVSGCWSGQYGASKPATGSYSGNSPCYQCQCSANDCTWTDSNKGADGSLATQCCNGNYLTCNKPSAINIPTGGYCSSYYNACGSSDICSDFACYDGWYKSGNTCLANTCTGYNLSSCPDHATCGNCKSGNTYKYQITSCNTYWTPNSAGTQCVADDCYEGSTSSSVSSCGYSSSYGVSTYFNGEYSGDTPCYSCKCEAPSDCRWSWGNAGSATLGGQRCCDGYYTQCTNTCPSSAISVPANATGYQCTGCGVSRTTRFYCNSGYTLSSYRDKCVNDEMPLCRQFLDVVHKSCRNGDGVTYWGQCYSLEDVWFREDFCGGSQGMQLPPNRPGTYPTVKPGDSHYPYVGAYLHINGIYTENSENSIGVVFKVQDQCAWVVADDTFESPFGYYDKDIGNEHGYPRGDGKAFVKQLRGDSNMDSSTGYEDSAIGTCYEYVPYAVRSMTSGSNKAIAETLYGRGAWYLPSIQEMDALLSSYNEISDKVYWQLDDDVDFWTTPYFWTADDTYSVCSDEYTESGIFDIDAIEGDCADRREEYSHVCILRTCGDPYDDWDNSFDGYF